MSSYVQCYDKVLHTIEVKTDLHVQTKTGVGT